MDGSNKTLYHVSGLTYTLPKLLLAMGLIFVGYAMFCICVSPTPTLVTMKLKELGISSTLLVFITTTIGQFFNMTVCPWVSFKSDRYRSERWGRRIPFILYTLPLMCASWLIIGCFREESWLLSKIISPIAKLSAETLAIIVISAGIIIFKFFYMFVGSVFFYIYNDVIPPQTMTRFTGGLTITASLSTAIYNFTIFPYAMSHFKWIMIGFAVLYALLMGMMCIFLKEPRFPDPEPEQQKKSNGLTGLLAFGKECFSHRIYVYGFINAALGTAAASSAIFVVFHQQSMGLDLHEIGSMNGISSLVRTFMALGAASIGAILIDRWHPVRVSILLSAFTVPVVFYDTRWLFFDLPPTVFWWVQLCSAIFLFITLFTDISGMPYLQLILPKSRFGQFCSARSLIASFTGMFFGLVMGGYIDILKIGFGLGERSYRGIYLWQVIFRTAAMIFSIMEFHQYRKLGGFSSYKAPAIWEPSGRETMEVSITPPPSIKMVNIVIRIIDVLFVLTVISPAIQLVTAKIWNVASGQNFYMLVNFPIAAIIFAMWLFIRKKITRNMEIIRNGGKASIPHHGILFMAAIMRLLFQGIFIMEAIMIMKISGDGAVAAKLNLYESLIDVIFLVLLWICITQEDPISNLEKKQIPVEAS